MTDNREAVINDRDDWPPFPDDKDQSWQGDQKAIFDARVDIIKKHIDADIALKKADRDANNANLSKWYDSISTLATNSIERARSGADTVQKASAAVAALYTGVLGVSFSVSDRPLPVRGILSPLFLGLAVVLSTAYLAYLKPSLKTAKLEAVQEDLWHETLARLQSYLHLARKVVITRAYVLRASVIALGVGVAFLAAPFISLPGGEAGTLPSWPAVPTATSTTTAQLEQTLFEAEVNEVAADRKAAATAGSGGDLEIELVAGAIFVGLIVVFVGGLIGASPTQAVLRKKIRGTQFKNKGKFKPWYATKPIDIDGLLFVGANPKTKWDAGQYVKLGDRSKAHWNGDKWSEGQAK